MVDLGVSMKPIVVLLIQAASFIAHFIWIDVLLKFNIVMSKDVDQ